MKLFIKIFLCTIVIISISLSLSSYIFIKLTFDNSMNREEREILNNFKTIKSAVQSNMIMKSVYDIDFEEIFKNQYFKLGNEKDNEIKSKIAIFNQDGEEIFSEFDRNIYKLVEQLREENTITLKIEKVENITYIIAIGNIKSNSEEVNLILATNISEIIIQKSQMQHIYYFSYGVTLIIGTILVFILTYAITHSIRKISKLSQNIAEGNYKSRINIKRKDEIGDLANVINQMTDVVEDKIEELSKNIEQREEFIADFAHEIKTPMTSVIGYADMIYKKDLSKEDIKKSAKYIFNEGIRIENLSFKLMDLIVLNTENFVIQSVNINEFINEVAYTLEPLLSENNVELIKDINNECNIFIEKDLLKTFFLNLIDNSIKAHSKKIIIKSEIVNGKCEISVIDNGIGIPEKELEKVTEAFYMVDKARDRRKHNVGLGLALCKKIANIHNTDLIIQSTENEGTIITINLNFELL